jgi:hypothetical protein
MLSNHVYALGVPGPNHGRRPSRTYASLLVLAEIQVRCISSEIFRDKAGVDTALEKYGPFLWSSMRGILA